MGRHELVNNNVTYESMGSRFYYENGIIPLDKDGYINSTTGWFHAFDPGYYQYPTNIEEWDGYITVTDDNKLNNLNIVKYKLTNMFRLLNTVMFTDVSEKLLSIETVGGKRPVRVRSLSPMYEDVDDFNDNNVINNYAIGEIYSIALANSLPNIVGDNYQGNLKNIKKDFTRW